MTGRITPLEVLATGAGILPKYNGVDGAEHLTTPETARALLIGIGLPAATDAEVSETLAEFRSREASRRLPAYRVVPADRPLRLDGFPGAWHLTGEDGLVSEGLSDGQLDLPALAPGYYTLKAANAETQLLAAPERLPLPDRAWGLTVPLYGLRGADRGGLGTYADLAVAGQAVARHGASFLGINPVHAGFPEDPRAFSPYAPSHRRRLNSLHVAPRSEVREQGGSLIDYGIEIRNRRAGLEDSFTRFLADGGDGDFDRFRQSEGNGLVRFATHQAISEVHGPYWTAWPLALRDPDSTEVAAFADEHGDRVLFHAWAQWQAERQLGDAQASLLAAGMAHGLYLDLAVGTHPSGAESWAEPEIFGKASLGAPPDAFAPEGQTWGLSPFNPLALERTGFRALAETLRAQFRFGGILRIDHILGFDRAYWVPDGAPGGYIRMPRAAMLAVARIEAARAGAVVIGEDLGNVTSGLRSAMTEGGILGCRVAMFERTGEDRSGVPQPEDYPATALASFGTHELPTWTGWRRGADIAAREDLGLGDDGAAQRAARAADVAAFDAVTATIVPEVPDTHSDRLNAYLAVTPSRLVALQADDILDVQDQPNLPGTIHEYPNWRRRLPVGGAALGDDPRLLRVGRIMSAAGRGARNKES